MPENRTAPRSLAYFVDDTYFPAALAECSELSQRYSDIGIVYWSDSILDTVSNQLSLPATGAAYIKACVELRVGLSLSHEEFVSFQRRLNNLGTNRISLLGNAQPYAHRNEQSIAAPITPQQLDGGTKVVDECLKLSKEEDLLIVCDAEYLQSARILLAACHLLQRDNCVICIPEAIIQRIGSPDSIPPPLATAIQKCAALIIVCNREHVPFRTSLSHFANDDKEAKVGTMPGVAPWFFGGPINADYSDIKKSADRLFPALVLGREVVVTTTDRFGKRHPLSFAMDGFHYVPFRSTGIIERGKSGNIPSGECFGNVVPGTIDGSYICDGSFPGHVIGTKTEEVELKFSNGILNDIVTNSKMAKSALDQRLKSPDASDWRPGCNLPCEFGIGINRMIGDLIGVPIHDEKRYGTVHIALGKNEHFGWGQKGEQHVDLVTLRPEVRIDGACIVEQEQITPALDTYEAVRLAQLKSIVSSLPPTSVFRRNHAVGVDIEREKWELVLLTENGRREERLPMQVVSRAMMSLCRNILKLIDQNEGLGKLGHLAAKYHKSEARLHEAIGCLVLYGVLRLDDHE